MISLTYNAYMGLEWIKNHNIVFYYNERSIEYNTNTLKLLLIDTIVM